MFPCAAIELALGAPLAEAPGGAATDDDAPLPPGMLASHYAPRTQVRLNADSLEAGEVLLAFGPDIPSGISGSPGMNLSPRGTISKVHAPSCVVAFIAIKDTAKS